MTIPETKFRILNSHPFFGTILFNLPIKEDKTIPTLGVDGETLFYNPDFWAKFDNQPKIQMGLLTHEAAHLFLKHLWRGRNCPEIVTGKLPDGSLFPFRLYNLAADYVVNLLVLDSYPLPKTAIVNEKYRNWDTESVYNDLKKTIPQMSSKELKELSDAIKNGNDKSRWGKTKQKSQEKWGRVVKQAFETAKQRGKLPANLQRFYDDLTPKEDWRNILKEFIQPFQNDYSFNPPDRRFTEAEFCLPDLNDGEKLDWAGIAIDTSGSINKEQISAFIGEIKGILSSCDKVKIKLTFCDVKATPFIELEELNDLSNIEVKGGGGTSFIEPFKLVKKEETPPVIFLYFTDLDGEFPSKNPEYPVLWIVNNHTQKLKSPFGKILSYKI